MFERIYRSDLPKWVSVFLSPDAIRIQGRYTTPFLDGVVLVAFWICFALSYPLLLALIALNMVPFSPVGSLLVLTILGFAARYLVLDAVALLFGHRLRIEFLRDRSIRIWRSLGKPKDYRPSETFQIAFGIGDHETARRLRALIKTGAFETFQKRLYADAATIEFRFGAEQVLVATFSKRRRAEEFIVVCNWALRELGRLDDETNSPLPAA